MTEGEQQAPQQEVRKENPVVAAARGAVRTAIETDEAYHDWKDTLTAKDKSVYRSWADAVDNFHASMTEADRNRLSTKLESAKMRLRGVWEQVNTSAVDFTFRHLGKVSKLAGVVSMGAGLAFLTNPVTAPIIAPIALKGGATLFGVGVASDVLRPKAWKQKGGLFLRKIPVSVDVAHANKEKSKRAAEKWAYKKTTEYKGKIRREQVKDIGNLVKERTKDILTGFAFPEGRAQ